MGSQKKRVVALQILLVIGMLVSLFLVYEHFSTKQSKFCTFDDSPFDCGIVNKSPYASLDGISFLLTLDFGLPIPLVQIDEIHWILDLLTGNAFLGFLTLLFVFFLIRAKQKEKGLWWIKEAHVQRWIAWLLTFGVLYGAYLFFIQHYILKIYCLFCLILDLILITACIIAWTLGKSEDQEL